MGKMLALILLMLWTVIAGVNNSVAEDQNSAGLKFLKEPPYSINFSNNKGAIVECTASGNPAPIVNWTLADNTPVINIPELREILPNGNLVLKPFKPENFRLDIHSTVYRCVASNSAGTIHSRDVNVHGVVLQAYEIQVYDTYVIERNTAVFKCNVPPVLRNHFKIVAWIKNENQLIEPANSESPDNKYAIMPNGELHIRDPALDESGSKFKCKTMNTLTGEMQSSSNAGQLFVTESMGIVHPKILDSDSTITASVEQIAILPCVAQGNPLPTVKWYKKGAANRTISLKTGGHYSLTKSALYIHEAKTDDEATYICEVYSEVGKEQLAISLRIVAPLAVIIQPAIQKAKNNEKVTFSCEIRGQPINTVVWRHNGTPVKNAVSNILVIEPVNASSQGIYQCFASNDEEMIQAIAELHLSEILPFFAETFNEVTMKSSGSVLMKCAATGVPNPIISWAIDEILIENSPRLQVTSETDKNGRVVSSLKIENTNASDGGTYSCTAENKAGKSVHMARINIYGEIGIRIVKEKIAVAGTTLYLNCPYYGYPVQEIGWEKDGIKLPSNFGQSLFENGTLIAEDIIKSADAGEYKCFAKSSDGRTAEGKLDVKILVPPRWITQPKDASVLKESNIMFNCKVEGFPKPKIVWKQGNDARQSGSAKLVVNSENIQLYPNGSLLIKSVKSINEGFYYCLASNGIGRGLSSRVELKINAPPFFKHLVHKQSVTVGGDAQLQCLVQGDTPISIAWYKSEKVIEDGQARHKIETTNTASDALSLLTIHKAERQDNGHYQCTAQNEFGVNNAFIEIAVLEPPDAPSDIKSTSVGSHTIEFVWTSSYSGNEPVKRYIIQYKKEGESWDAATTMETANGEPTNSIVTKLQPATNYLFRVFAENSQGRSLASQILRVTTSEDVPNGPPRKVNVEPVNTETFKVTWKAPEEKQWNGKLLGYYIGYKEVDTNDPFLYKTLLTPEPTFDAMFVQIGGLKQFTKYAVVIQAYNIKGKGPESDTVVVMTSEGAPSLAPDDVHCSTITSQSIHITWMEPPKDSINGILSGYKVLYKPASDWFEDVAENFNITLKTPMTLNHLEKFTNYSIQVLAMTKAGEGPKSSPVFCKTLDDAPGQPEDIKAIATSNDSIIVAWKPPQNPNGVIQSYSVYWRDTGNVKDMSAHTITARLNHYEVTKLKKGRYYEFWVKASTLAGEGQSSKTVFQGLDGPRVPAKIVSFENKLIMPLKADITLPCQSVGIPEPSKAWTVKKNRLQDGDRYKISEDGTLTVKRLREEDAGDYTCSIQNEFGKDEITYAIIVLAPPNAPQMEVKSTTSDTIELQWNIPASKMSRIKGYTINFRKDVGDWTEVTVGSDARTYQITNLDCGTRYEIFMQAFNKIGIGAPSDVFVVSTNGSVPSAPSKDDLIEESSNSISLYLNSWKSNGCPILYFMVEYAPKSSYEWTSVSSNEKPEERRLVISSLKPATWFALRMTAHNSAGSSIANYDFATLTLSGATIMPELQGDAPNQKIDGLMATLNFYIIVPIACTAIILLAIFAMACMCVKMKKREEAQKGNRMSVVSSELKRTDSSESFSYMQRGTLNRQTNEDVNYGDVEIAPYATLPFSHNMQLMATLQRRQQLHGPPLPTGFEGFPADGMPMMHQPFFPPDSNFMPGPEHSETTFVFPNPPSEAMLQNMDNIPSYQNEQQQAELMENKATFI